MALPEKNIEVSGAMPSSEMSLRMNSTHLVSTSVRVPGRMVKEKAPVAPGESSSAQTVISAAPSSGLTSQKVRKCGNSSGLPTAVSMASPRADAP